MISKGMEGGGTTTRMLTRDEEDQHFLRGLPHCLLTLTVAPRKVSTERERERERKER